MREVEHPAGEIVWAGNRYVLQHVECDRCGAVLICAHDRRTGETSRPARIVGIVAGGEMLHCDPPHDCGPAFTLELDPRRN